MRRHQKFSGGSSRRGRASGGSRGLRGGRWGQGLGLSFDVLEDRRLMSVSPGDALFRDLVDADVVGRYLLYNNSAFDGNNPALNAADDGAIAPDKMPLLPGGTASFANYSSYSRGINGLVIDIAGLPSATLTADDFTFRVGNSGAPESWTLAPAPTAINVRPGAGDDMSARVLIAWADGAIQKQWLEVTIKSTVNTGLAKADVFYFGIAVGESGNIPADAIVDQIDATGAQDNPRSAANPAPIDFDYDYNRDGLVDAADVTIANANTTNSTTALQLISLPMPAPTPDFERLQPGLFHWGDANFPVYYAPTLVTTTAGTVLAIAEGRQDTGDNFANGLILRRSLDGGATWQPAQVIFSASLSDAAPYTGNPAPVVDRVTGEIFLLFTRGNSEVYVTSSTDDGLSWRAPTNITASVKVTATGNPGPPGMYPDTPWGWYATGPGHGIQLEHGPYAGRLMIACDHREGAGVNGASWSHVIYSDDHGRTWKLGGGLKNNANGTPSPNDNSNEATVLERGDGSLLMSIRIQRPNINYRGQSFSFDGGTTWTSLQIVPLITSSQVQGSLLRVNDRVIVFVSPSNPVSNQRRELTVWASYNDGLTWTKKKVLFFGYSGYSDLTLVGPDTVLVAFNNGYIGGGFNGGSTAAGDFRAQVSLVRFNVRWLESNDPYEFTWHFNEQPAGTPANANGPSLRDSGGWDQRAWAYSYGATPPMYVPGAAGDTALEFTEGADQVVLTQSYNTALQAKPGESFTVQLMMKTSDDFGVIIGTRPTIQNWSLLIVDGKLQFTLSDGSTSSVITSDLAINDGQWHHVAAVRDAADGLLKLYVDYQSAATPVADTTTLIPLINGSSPVDPVILGTYNVSTPIQGKSPQLSFTVDMVRFTTAVLEPETFWTLETPVPVPPPETVYPANNPTTIPGLHFWLPAFDPQRYFADYGNYANPVQSEPYTGMAARSMLDASANQFRVQTDNPLRSVHYAEDQIVGPYWRQVAAPQARVGQALAVQSVTGANPKNFNFVQDTGVFTLSTFVKIDGETGADMTLLDTNNGKVNLSGFTLYRTNTGRLGLLITGANSLVRFFHLSDANLLQSGGWYHIAVVGSGPGQPVQFYVTPAGALAPTVYTSPATITGVNGSYPTITGYNLTLGSRSNTNNTSTIEPTKAPVSFLPLNGAMVNTAVYTTALTPAQVQQLFEFGQSALAGVPAPAPTGVELYNESDSGWSNYDGVTNFDNSADEQSLQFYVFGTVKGATVSLYADGVLIGSAMAFGNITTVTTDGIVAIPNGVRSITARQTIYSRPESVDSPALALTIDTMAPVGSIPAISPSPRSTPVEKLQLQFNELLIGLDLGHLKLTRDGGPNLLTEQQWLSTDDGMFWTLHNLSALTATPGVYQFWVEAPLGGLVDLAGNDAVLPSASSFIVSPTVVVGRHLFYNQSKFDGSNAALNASDDAAIASDKTAYLPGSGQASFANTTSYSRGINGLMIDIAGPLGTLSAADFSFRLGTNNAPQSWAVAPAPLAINVRPGVGEGGADRVVIVWPNGAIQNTWLQVTVMANANTGLTKDDVFYFGNLIGNSGLGDGALLSTTPTDELAVRSHPGFQVPVTNPYDFNRDGSVTPTDQLVARSHPAVLARIQIGGSPPAPPAGGLVETMTAREPADDQTGPESAPSLGARVVFALSLPPEPSPRPVTVPLVEAAPPSHERPATLALAAVKDAPSAGSLAARGLVASAVLEIDLVEDSVLDDLLAARRASN